MDKESIIIINDSNLNSGIVHKQHVLIHASYYWHKVHVKNAINYSREFVLRTIMKAVHPLDFIPVCFAIEDNEVTFMLKNCGPAIDKMCGLNLIIPHPDVQRNLPPFKISIMLKFAHATELKFDIQSNISKVLNKRYSSQTKTLNLENFIKDADLNVFCPLSQPKLLYFVLHLSKDFDVVHLMLNNNELETFKQLEAIYGFTAGKALTTLDLSDNCISAHDALAVLKSFTITELLLHNNPLCGDITESEYIKLIKSNCPHIVKIDSVNIPSVGWLTAKRNYLCEPMGRNFVEHFLEHYFTLYDLHNRDLLINMYHKNAMLSITSQSIGFQSDSAALKRFHAYKQLSRNLKTLSDLSKGHEFIFYGTKSIENVLKVLPETEHDPSTFTVDLLQFTEKSVTISISGVFKEPGQSLLESEYFYGFSRTFILVPVDTMEYNITNEMLHVTNATPSQQATAFKDVRISRSTSITILDAETLLERSEMVGAFVALTNLVPEWALKCLKEAAFNLQSALMLFTDLMKTDKLPLIAFDFSDMEQDSTTAAAPDSTVGHQSAELKLSNMKPVETSLGHHKINMIPTVKPVSTKSYIPPKSKTQPQILPVDEKSSQAPKLPTKQAPKQSAPPTHNVPSPSLVKANQKVAIQKLPEQKLQKPQAPNPPPPPAAVPVAPPTKLIEPKLEKEHELLGQPLFAVAVTPQTKGPGIVLNLQKKQPVVSPSAVDSSVTIDTNIGELWCVVKDPTILKILDMALETPLNQVKLNLEAACAQILKEHTCVLQCHKAVGREFYRFQLYVDARNFLAKAMAMMPKKLGEQLYCIYTLFELQYGEQNVAENMILIIAESFDINTASVFLSRDLPKTNAGFARKVFGMIAASDLARDKKDVMLKAHIEFEKVFGNVDTLRFAQKAFMECHVSESKTDDEPDVKPVIQTSGEKEEEEKKEVAVKVELNVSAQSESGILEQSEVQKAIETIIIEDDPVNKPSPPSTTSCESNKEMTFFEFRERLLRSANLLPQKVAHEEIGRFLTQTDKETVEKVGEELLNKYSNDFYVIRTVCKAWQKLVSTVKVAKAIGNIKKAFAEDPKILNPLILYLKVREDVDGRKYDDAKRKLFTHIKISSYVQIIQVFEDLLMDARDRTDNEYNEFLDATLKEATQPKQMPLAKMQLLVAIYVTFCQIIGSSAANEVYTRFFPPRKYWHFYPEDIRENAEVKRRRALYESTKILPKELVRDAASFKEDCFEGQVEEMRMYYYLKNHARARQLRNSYSATNAEHVRDFRLASAYYEALFGSPTLGITQLRRTGEEAISSICVAILCFHKNLNGGMAKNKLHQIFSYVAMIMNPYSQQLMFKYYKIWLSEGFNIFDSTFQFHGSFQDV